MAMQGIAFAAAGRKKARGREKLETCWLERVEVQTAAPPPHDIQVCHI